MSFLGNVVTSFQKWATDKISTIESKQVVTKEYTSPEQAITSAGLLTLSHGLGVTPKAVQCFAVCKVAEAGYNIGDVLLLGGTQESTSTNDGCGFAILVDSTNIRVRFGSTATVLLTMNFTTGIGTNLTNANWRVIIKAYA